MKVEFVEPFVKAARDVFQLMMDLMSAGAD